MNGRGVTNYNSDKPTYDYTTATTEFDDALVKRGIVTTEQVMLAKGASVEDAIRLAQEKKNENTVRPRDDFEAGKGVNDDENDVDDDDDDDDDEFFARYRQQRLEQLKREHQSSAGATTRIKEITRDQWIAEVNEASQLQWIIVVLTDAPSRQRVLQETHNFLRQQSNDDDDEEEDDKNFSFCIIPASQAIANWPSERVPAIFAYRNGLKQHEWIADSNGMFPSPIAPLLRQWQIVAS